MLTRDQKKNQVENGVKAIKNSQSLLFADFSGLPISVLKELRLILRAAGAKFKVLKKRLFKIALKESGVDYDPTQFQSQVGIIFIPEDVLSVAGNIDKFSRSINKANKHLHLNILGGFDIKESKIISAEEFKILAKLPTREVLLSQLAISFIIPIKQLMFALNGRKEQLETK